MSLIRYHFPHVFKPGSDKLENAQVLAAMCNLLIQTNLAYLRNAPRLHRSVPTLYRSGVVYKRSMWWEPIPALYDRQWGDCKSLANALIAEYLIRGIRCVPVFRWTERLDGTPDYHILVQVGNKWEDPSKVLGMGADENSKFFTPQSFSLTPQNVLTY